MDYLDTLRTAAQRPADCEFTAPGAETEAIDCWANATVRHVVDDVDDEGKPTTKTVGVFCDLHTAESLRVGETVERIESFDVDPLGFLK